MSDSTEKIRGYIKGEYKNFLPGHNSKLRERKFDVKLYREKNRDKHKEYCKRYYFKHKKKLDKKNRIWMNENWDKALAQRREHYRKTILKTTGGRVWYHINKRNHPGNCELCGKLQDKHLGYHHWDDNNPGLGLWLCMSCHQMAEAIEKNLILKYYDLKNKVIRESKDLCSHEVTQPPMNQ